MEKLKINISRYQNKQSPNHTANWQLLGQEVSEYFGKSLYWLFYRFPEDHIVECYKYCKHQGISKYQVLIALLQKSK